MELELTKKITSIISTNTKNEDSAFFNDYQNFMKSYEVLIKNGFTQKRQTNLPDFQEDYILKMTYSFGK